MIGYFSTPLLEGLALGIFFYGGLWWTVQNKLNSTHAALWFMVSFWLRMGVVLAGFYLMMAADWRRLLVALAGFLIARIIIVRIQSLTAKEQDYESELR